MNAKIAKKLKEKGFNKENATIDIVEERVEEVVVIVFDETKSEENDLTLTIEKMEIAEEIGLEVADAVVNEFTYPNGTSDCEIIAEPTIEGIDVADYEISEQEIKKYLKLS